MLPPHNAAQQPVDHEKVVISQMLVESFSNVVNMRVQMAAMQAALAEKDAEIATLKAQLAPPPEAEPVGPAESQ